MSNKVEDLKKAKDGLDVWPDLLQYSKTGFSSITPDDMTRFRWYGIYEQQPKVGHFMMRVKIPGGDISSDQWRVLGEIARDFGQGVADITTRQNVQFHWLTIESIPQVIQLLETVGLSTVGACGDITRNVTGCPTAGIDPHEIYDCRQIIQDITRYFEGNKEFSDLPRKYKMSISGCSNQCHQPEINDVGFTAVRQTVSGELTVGFHVHVGGGLSTQPHFGQVLNMFILPEQVPEVARAITEVFRDEGYRARRNHARLKFLVADWGAEKFGNEVTARLGWTPLPADEHIPSPSPHEDHLGVHKQVDGKNWIGTAVLTGRLTAAKMLAAAEIAEKYCDGVLRTTNQQNLLFPNIVSEDLPLAEAALKSAGFPWQVGPVRRASISCTGTEFCNLAITETKHRLAELVDHIEANLPLDEPIRINLNGCPNSCGQHHIGDIGLQGCLGRVDGERVEAYDVCLGGRLGGNHKFTRPIERKVPATRVKYALENLLRTYLSKRADEEVFSGFVDRHTDEELGNMLGLENIAAADPDFVPPRQSHAPAGV